MISKLAFSLIFLAIILVVTISPPFEEYAPRKIFESATSFRGMFSNPNDPDHGEIDIAAANSSSQEKVAVTGLENCNLFSGEWIPNPEGPYYTNETCYKMHEYQNCMKHERPDTGYMKWRWKPDSCELPIFDPNQFLELVRGKSIAFVGDSMARNQMQSLGCLLSRVVVPEDVSSPEFRESQDWVYRDYNFNMSMYWAPYLIRVEQPDPSPINLHLDEFDEYWTSKIESYHYIILSAGRWFFHPSKFYENRRLIGCYACKEDNVTELENYTAYQKAFRTALRAINSLAKPEGIIFLRTVSPSHFEGGPWDDGGDCVRTRPFKRNQTVLDPYHSIMREIQLEEFKIAVEEGSKRGLRIRLLDVTQSMLLRPDGHPSKYGHWSTEKIPNDCVHWCLPGPVDVWNDLLLQLFIREGRDLPHKDITTAAAASINQKNH